MVVNAVILTRGGWRQEDQQEFRLTLGHIARPASLGHMRLCLKKKQKQKQNPQ